MIRPIRPNFEAGRKRTSRITALRNAITSHTVLSTSHFYWLSSNISIMTN